MPELSHATCGVLTFFVSADDDSLSDQTVLPRIPMADFHGFAAAIVL